MSERISLVQVRRGYRKLILLARVRLGRGWIWRDRPIGKRRLLLAPDCGRWLMCGAAARFVERLRFPGSQPGFGSNRIARTSSIECTSLACRELGTLANAGVARSRFLEISHGSRSRQHAVSLP